MGIFNVSFIGHRDFYDLRKIENTLPQIIEDLLEKNDYVDFYIGRNGEFDICVASVIKRTLKELESRNGTLILALPYSYKDEEYFEKYYDEIIYPVPYKTHYKSAITKRNEWMVDNSNLLIAYVEHEHGGAYETVKYAKSKKKEIINLAEIKEI